MSDPIVNAPDNMFEDDKLAIARALTGQYDIIMFDLSIDIDDNLKTVTMVPATTSVADNERYVLETVRTILTSGTSTENIIAIATKYITARLAAKDGQTGRVNL